MLFLYSARVICQAYWNFMVQFGLEFYLAKSRFYWPCHRSARKKEAKSEFTWLICVAYADVFFGNAIAMISADFFDSSNLDLIR